MDAMTTMTDTTDLPKLTRGQAYTMRDQLAELEGLERHLNRLQGLRNDDVGPQEMIAEIASDMDDDEAQPIAEQMHAQALAKARAACEAKAATIGFTWTEPEAEDDSEELEIEDEGYGCGCGTADPEAPIAVSVPA